MLLFGLNDKASLERDCKQEKVVRETKSTRVFQQDLLIEMGVELYGSFFANAMESKAVQKSNLTERRDKDFLTEIWAVKPCLVDTMWMVMQRQNWDESKWFSDTTVYCIIL